jgi:hypothetical protein
MASAGEEVLFEYDTPDDKTLSTLIETFDWVAELFEVRHAELLGTFFDLPNDWRDACQRECDADNTYAVWQKFGLAWRFFYDEWNKTLRTANWQENGTERPTFADLEKPFKDFVAALQELLAVAGRAALPVKRLNAACRAVYDGRAQWVDDNRIIAVSGVPDDHQRE